MASVSPWSIAGGKIKRTFLRARLNCQRNGRRWDASRQSIRSLIKRILEWFTEQRSQGKFSVEQQKHDHKINQSADHMCDSQNYRSIM